MRDTAKTGFDPAQDDRHRVLEVLADKVCIDVNCPVWTFVVLSARRIIITVSELFRRRIVGNHRVDASPAYTPIDTRFAKALDIIIITHIRLADDPDFETQFLKHTSDHRHTDVRRVYIGIACDQDNVQLVPTAFFHLFACCRQIFKFRLFHGRILSEMGFNETQRKKVIFLACRIF